MYVLKCGLCCFVCQGFSKGHPKPESVKMLTPEMRILKCTVLNCLKFDLNWNRCDVLRRGVLIIKFQCN